MNTRVGTSGYSYAPWKGSFYPEDLKAADMLRYYSQRFPTVEINNTFYRMPTAPLIERWASETPESFSFVLKAPRRLTHEKRLEDPESEEYFFRTAGLLADRFGPTLFQLPPFFKKDLARLQGFLARIPNGRRVALEFRHASWFDDEIYDALRASGAALCLADTDEAPNPAIEPTTDWGYLRLRRIQYDETALDAWAARIRSQPWKEAWVFFKHEDAGTGPKLARQLIERLG